MKKIEGYENYYITTCGKVFSKKQNGFKQLSPSKTHGYRSVVLSKNGKTKTMKIHRLVALAFIDNPLNKPHVNHIDEDRSNNSIVNLEWVTQTENNNHGTRIEKARETRKKTEAGKIKVCQYYFIDNEKIIVKIWNSGSDAAKEGFNGGNISRCCKGKQKTYKGFYWEYYKE